MKIWYFLVGLTLLSTSYRQFERALPGQEMSADTLRQPIAADTLKSRPADSLARPYLTVVSRPAEPFMIQRIAFVDDFLARLNYQRTPTHQAFDSLSRLAYPRERYVRMLFNEEDPRLNLRSGRYSPAYQTLVDDFVTTVATDTAAVLLPKDSMQLFGEVEYSVLYRNTPHKIRFFLKQHRVGSGHDWKIIDAQAAFLKITKADTMTSDTVKRNNPHLYISSETHETRFLNLYKLLRSHENLLAFTLEGYPPSPALLRLARALRDGSLTLQETQQVNLYLDVRRGWLLKLNDFHREKENAGWLITDLYSVEYRSPLPAPIDRFLTWAALSKKSD
ncbi:hypothetical protein [Larkinella rosea]|uniref:Uncharacterized protein n=1 Tax=Larkinella rosea TaxID=2025312 RepID=A0A3P1BG76_9BACT|nr:hypothetical protein [Larkinella rosea]RRB00100.1 hypothetical protein EHT25_26110 [Larkinella rosea]